MTIMMSLRNNTQPRFLHDVYNYLEDEGLLYVVYNNLVSEVFKLDCIWWYREYDMSLEKKCGQPAVVNTPVLQFSDPAVRYVKPLTWEEWEFQLLFGEVSVTWNVKPKDKNNDEII